MKASMPSLAALTMFSLGALGAPVLTPAGCEIPVDPDKTIYLSGCEYQVHSDSSGANIQALGEVDMDIVFMKLTPDWEVNFPIYSASIVLSSGDLGGTCSADVPGGTITSPRWSVSMLFTIDTTVSNRIAEVDYQIICRNAQ